MRATARRTGTKARTSTGGTTASGVSAYGAVAALVMTVVGGLGFTVWRAQTGDPAVLLRADPGVTTLVATAAVPTTVPEPATTTTVALAAIAPPTTAPPRLPIPDPLPEDSYAPAPEIVLGTLSIPKIDLEQHLVQGMTLTAINRGPSQWPGTALPGQLGNMVVAGHRTTYSKPFHDLDLLVPGDRMIVSTVDGGVHTYAVTSTEIVTPDQTRIADQTWGYTATLFACHPPGSAAYRIVAHLQLVDADGRPVAPPPPPTTPPATSTPARVPVGVPAVIPALGGS